DLEVRAHHGGVNDVGCAQVPARREDRLTDFNRALPDRLFLDDDPALAFDGGGDSRSHGEVGIGGIDDGIDVPVRDVAALDSDARLTDLELHRQPCSLRRSSAFAACHDSSNSSCETLATALPPALSSASMCVNRRRNFSIAQVSASSASTDASRATFTSENNTSPSSSLIRARSPLTIAAPASCTSSSTFDHAAAGSGQSKWTRAALAWVRWARRSAGSVRGTPSITERVRPAAAASRCFNASHWASA